MPAPEIIQVLVKRFTDNISYYKSKNYNEAQLRQEFLDPFFEALGWDIYNKKDYAPRYREVIVEKPISFLGSQASKTPDYTFRLGEDPKFFVEAKRPSENLQASSEFAFQLKAYAWNKHLPLSILTDFEEFLVFDCRRKPTKSDRPDVDCIMKLTYEEYIEKWDELVSIFSPVSIRKGAFDKYAEDNTSKKGVSEVDDEFLKDISTWRELLARNIALRNQSNMDESNLNYAVQMTIDRIIFLRICEDRGIEPFNQLRELAEKPDVYQNLKNLFKRAELKFNSGLFTFNNHKKEHNTHQDNLTPTLAIDDKVLKQIITGLYYPASTYNFKAIPVEILGQVYEQFLGKVIRLTPGHQAKIEEKPEVRKAGGVYYTPKYIVDYIVANTVGKLLEGKTPDQVSQLRIVDPACGSGSFLLGAFQYLMDWHEEYYLSHDPQQWVRGKEPALAPLGGDEYRLSTPEKKRILINNIYGVDIDAQAVEVTKLSLLLKVLEEETGQLSLGLEHALPDLGNNIKCGNSLIGWDYFEGQLIPDEKEVKRINPFNWQDAFPEVFAKGGFDAVIGNPPYVRSNNMDPDQKRHWQTSNSYFTVTGKFDIYILFIEKGINILSKNGHLGFIVPYPVLSQTYGALIRKYILNNCIIYKILDVSELKIFSAKVSTCVIILKRDLESAKRDSNKITIEKTDGEFLKRDISEVSQKVFTKTIDNMFRLKVDVKIENISEKIIQKSKPFSDYCYIGIGLDAHDSKTGYDKSARIRLTNESKSYKPYVEGKDIERYGKPKWYRFIDYKPEKMHRPKYPELFENEKIIVQVVVGRDGIIATYDDENLYAEQTLSICMPKYMLAYSGKKDTEATQDQIHLSKSHNIKYLLGLLCSKLSNWYFKIWLSDELHVVPENLRNLPINTIDFTNPTEVKKHDQMVSLVEHMLELHKRTPQTPHEQEMLQREISATDAQIDRLVYELYGLTEEEIKIVEES